MYFPLFQLQEKDSSENPSPEIVRPALKSLIKFTDKKNLSQ